MEKYSVRLEISNVEDKFETVTSLYHRSTALHTLKKFLCDLFDCLNAKLSDDIRRFCRYMSSAEFNYLLCNSLYRFYYNVQEEFSIIEFNETVEGFDFSDTRVFTYKYSYLNYKFTFKLKLN